MFHIQEEIRSSPSNLLINQPNPNESLMPVRGIDELPKPPVANRREIMHSILELTDQSFQTHIYMRG